MATGVSWQSTSSEVQVTNTVSPKAPISLEQRICAIVFFALTLGITAVLLSQAFPNVSLADIQQTVVQAVGNTISFERPIESLEKSITSLFWRCVPTIRALS